jgi:hypothetical protein
VTRDSIKVTLDVNNESLSEKYLGLPSDVGSSTNGAFKYLKDRVWNRVHGWMEQCLSPGGKEVLTKSVAQVIPTYSMSCFKLPRGLCLHINSLLRNFWWGSSEGKRKTCCVSWDDMAKPKFFGGLGFRDIELFNLALLAKQAWKILQDGSSLSARILKAVYFPSGDFLATQLGPRPSRIWRSILDGRDVLKQGLIRRIGTGESTEIWNMNWLPREGSLRPVRSISATAPILVSELIDATTATWDMQLLETFFTPVDMETIGNIPLCTRKQEDFWAWHHEKSDVFSVRSAYRMLVIHKHHATAYLEHTAGRSDLRAEEWLSIWKLDVPSKIHIFLWRLTRNSIPSGDVLLHRNMHRTALVASGVQDSWKHSLIECNLARCVWALEQAELVEHLYNIQEIDAHAWWAEATETIPTTDLT